MEGGDQREENKWIARSVTFFLLFCDGKLEESSQLHGQVWEHGANLLECPSNHWENNFESRKKPMHATNLIQKRNSSSLSFYVLVVDQIPTMCEMIN